MDVVALLQDQAVTTLRTLAPYVVEPYAGGVIQYPPDPSRSPIIVKRFATEEKAEDFLLTLCPKPTPTRVDS